MVETQEEMGTTFFDRLLLMCLDFFNQSVFVCFVIYSLSLLEDVAH